MSETIEHTAHETDSEAMLREAREIGADHGENAAAWMEQDTVGGRVTDGSARETAERILRGLEEGDPEILDALPRPDLSGQWADGYTPRQLAEDVGLGPCDSKDDRLDLLDSLCNEYEQAFYAAVEAEVVRFCRAALSD